MKLRKHSSPEVEQARRDKISAAAKIRCAAPEFRAKVAERQRQKWADPQYREMMQQADKQAWDEDDGTRRETLVNALRAYERTPEHCKAISESLKGKPNWANGLTKENSEIMARKSQIAIAHY